MWSNMCVLTFQSNWLHTLRVEVTGSERLHSIGCHGWREGGNAYTSSVCEPDGGRNWAVINPLTLTDL
jgi:hypothetical protein